ncbi:MAG: response regulator [Planctomycetota bacterium]
MRQCKVLVVDDETDFLDSLVRRLCRRGLEAVGVTSGEAALERLPREPFDVVVLDVKMPGMDGIEVLRRLKEKGIQVEVILLTGHASVESGVDGVELGAFDYLIKPVKLDDLMERIRDADERGQLVRKTAP